MASDFPEMKKVVKDNNVGLVIDPSDQNSIADKISLLLNDNEKYSEMKKNCVNASEKYLWDTIQEDFVNYVI